MKRYMMPGLYAAFCLSWAGAITCVVLHEDVWGRWIWMLSVCAALLFLSNYNLSVRDDT